MTRRLKADHDRIRAIVRDLVTQLERQGAADLATVARCRWQLAREVLQHLPVEDRAIYAPLTASRARDMARAAQVEFDTLYADFKDHVARWPAERVAADWPGYRAAVLPLAARLVARMDREERELYPLALRLWAGRTCGRVDGRPRPAAASL